MDTFECRKCGAIREMPPSPEGEARPPVECDECGNTSFVLVDGNK